MTHVSPPGIVMDTSLLVNFLRINRMDLIAQETHDYLVTDHVAGEITDHYQDQRARFEAALEAGYLRQLSIIAPEELAIFGSLVTSGRLGAGECSSIALAVHRRHILAIDDQRATREARGVRQNLRILATQDLIVAMIYQGLLDVQEADAIKNKWAKEHRFRLIFGSFAELLDGS